MGKDLFNDRISRFSIRKLNVGVCSVLLGTLVMVGTASQVSADETANQVQAGDVASTTATVSDETSSQNAVAAQLHQRQQLLQHLPLVLLALQV